MPGGFYGLHHIILTLCFMFLCRIKNPEQLKKYPPGEFGKLLGLDRIPEVGYFRTKLKQITDQSKCDELHTALLSSWTKDMPEMFFYIDGHVRVYHGQEANLPKRFVSRQKLCLSGTTEYWVNDGDGLPLMVLTGELNEKLKIAIQEVIPKILKEVPLSSNPQVPAFTLVFDREAYEPKWFAELWKKYRVAVLTYRKNVQDEWDESLFYKIDLQSDNNDVTMQICEMGTRLNGHWFREVRKLSQSGHQTAIITTHPTLSAEITAAKMFVRWTQENFFKYVMANFDFDRMIQYGTEPVDQKRSIPNPEYSRLTYMIKKGREKKGRKEARLFKKINKNGQPGIQEINNILLKNDDLVQLIDEYNRQIESLLKRRKEVPSRITVEQMPEQQRYNKLIQESKKLKNAIVMIDYRAESALYNILVEVYKDAKKDGRQILQEIFTSDADMIPDYQKEILIVRLHCLSTPRANKAANKLCDFLNQTQTLFPLTNMRMVYETVAL